jgi:hypothetical protein
LLFVACTGCTTTTVTDANDAVLVGRVYDENAVPLSGATVESGRFRGISDSSGRFRIDGIPYGTREFAVSRRDHESVTTTIRLYSPAAYARVTLWSLAGLIDRAIHLLNAGTPDEARGIYHRCVPIDAPDERVRLLGEILGEPR